MVYKKSACIIYDTKYLSFGFTNIDVDGDERSQFLPCMKIFTADSMKPKKLKRHLETMNAESVGKIQEHFPTILNEFNTQNQ